MSSQTQSPKEMFSNLVQIGIVVRDLDRTTKTLSEVFGLGPFRTIAIPPDDGMQRSYTYRRQTGHFTYRLALATVGEIELEIIQPLEGDSIYSDFLREHGEGIHHIRFNVADVHPVIEYLARHGIENIQSGSGLRAGTTWVNFGTDAQCGFIIEIMNALPGTDGHAPQIVDGKIQL